MEPPVARHVYDAEDVRAYIDSLHAEIDDLREQLETGTDRMPERAEALLGRALLTAQRAADDVIAEAHEDARRIRSEAERKAADIVARARRAAEDLSGRSQPPGSGEVGEGREGVDTVARRLAEEAHRRLDEAFAARREERRSVEGGYARPHLVRLRSERDAERPSPLAATGTDNLRPLRPTTQAASAAPAPPAPARAVPAPPAPTARPRPSIPPSPPSAAPRSLWANLRERWRVAAAGSAAFADDELLGRSAHLESIHDGSYVNDLRGSAPTPRLRHRHRRSGGVLSFIGL